MTAIKCDTPEVIARCRKAIDDAVNRIALFDGTANEQSVHAARMYLAGYVNGLMVEGLISVATMKELDAERNEKLEALPGKA